MNLCRIASVAAGRKNRPLRAAVLGTAALLSVPGTDAAAQTAGDLFNPSVLHRIDLLVNSRDWGKLKATYQTDEHYPAILHTWGQTLAQHLHLHCLVTGGALAADRRRGSPVDPRSCFRFWRCRQSFARNISPAFNARSTPAS